MSVWGLTVLTLAIFALLVVVAVAIKLSLSRRIKTLEAEIERREEESQIRDLNDELLTKSGEADERFGNQ